VLCEKYAQGMDASSNMSQVSLDMLARLDPYTSRKQSFAYNNDVHVHVMVDAGLIYLCFADAVFAKRRAYAYLIDIRNLFLGKFGDAWQYAIAYSMDAQFSRIMDERMKYFTYDVSSDKIIATQNEIAQAQQIATQGIETLIDRGQQIDILVKKSEELSAESMNFRDKSTTLKRKLWWRNTRIWIAIGVCCCIIIAVLIIVIVFACGPPNFPRCGGKSN